MRSLLARLALVSAAVIGGWTAVEMSPAAFGPGFGGGGGRGRVPAPEPGVIDVPATPSISLIVALDTSTVKVDAGPFQGDQGDPLDSIQVQVSSSVAFTDTLVDSLTATSSQRSDTLASNVELFADSTYYLRWRDHGAVGGWSAWSTVQSYVNSPSVGTISNLSVCAQSDTSLTLCWNTVSDGHGGVAYHAIRRSDTDPFLWWEPEESSSEVFDSTGTSVGEAVSREMTGLSPGSEYKFGIKAYYCASAGCPPGAEYGPLSNIASGTTTGSEDPDSPPATPTLTLTATPDTSEIQMNGSGFAGDGSHAKTHWQIDNNSNLASPFYSDSTAVNLTSVLVTDNANLTAGNTYYGRVRYRSEFGWSEWSTIQSVANSAPGTYPNEPGGMTQLVSTNEFSTGSLPGNAAWTFNNTPGPTGSVETDATSPGADSNVMRITYTAGSGGGGGTDQVRNTALFPDDTKELYFHFWFFLTSNWQGHSSFTNKIFFFSNGASGSIDNGTFWSLRGSGSSSMHYGIQNQSQVGQGGGVRNFSWNNADNEASPSSSQATVTRGQWHRVEIHIIAPADGQQNGRLRGWLNEVLVFQFNWDGSTSDPDFDWFNPSAGPEAWRGVKNSAIWGGIGDEVQETMWIQFDEVYLSGSPG